MDPIIDYLIISQLPKNQEVAWRIRNTSVRYTMINKKLYRIRYTVQKSNI